MQGARGVLLNVTGGLDLGLVEVNEAAQIIAEAADPDANIIFGAVIDDGMKDEVRITVIATGFDVARTREAAEGVDRAPTTASPPQDVPVKTFIDDLDVPAFLRKR